MPLRRPAAVLLTAVAVAACVPLVVDSSSGDGGARGGASASASAAQGQARPPVELEGRLPGGPGPFEPSRLQVEGKVSGHDLVDVDGCARCHADIAAQWRQSAHALGSFNNPIYRTAIDKLRHDVGPTPSRFCAGCHDIALLVDGAMDGDIKPEDPRAHAGINCRVCHSIKEAHWDGNGSYTLAGSPIPVPVEGDAQSVKRHVERAGMDALKTPQFCAACHKAFLHPGTGNPSHLVGQDDATPWQRSGYANNRAARVDQGVEAKTCRDCHMPSEAAVLGDAAAKEGRVRSHRFLGGHTYLASLRRDQDQLRRAQAMLEQAATIDVPVLVHPDGSRSLPAEGAPVAPGEAVLLDVVVRNARVGHRFPGGVGDAQDTWIEVVVRDAQGKLVAEAGQRHEREADDPTAHRLRALQADDHGKPQLARETHRFRATVYNHTILPRDAVSVQYAFSAPSSPEAFPLRVTARLRHRSRSLELQEASCNDARTPRGVAFLEASRKLTGTTLSPCAPQPITDVDQVEVWVGSGSDDRPRPARPLWQRLYEHGLGAMHAVQERLDEARPSLERALQLAPGKTEQAIVLGALATVAARQGRVEEAEVWLQRATPLAPQAPALPRIRGEALSQVWRWADAVEPLRQASLGAPGDDGLLAQLALALGSSGDAAGSLDVARRGLVFQPRDADLLRIQALALGSLGAPEPLVSGSRDAYLGCRTPDEAPHIRAACGRDVPGCALERNPVHTHTMRR